MKKEDLEKMSREDLISLVLQLTAGMNAISERLLAVHTHAVHRLETEFDTLPEIDPYDR